jgi:hypothetical protein
MKRYRAAADISRNRLPHWDDHFSLLSAGLRNLYLDIQARN